MQQLRPDLVLLDIHLPEVVARVRAVLRRTQMRLDSASAPIRVGAIEIDAQATAPSATTRPATPSRCRSR